jgi:hypothetical protein
MIRKRLQKRFVDIVEDLLHLQLRIHDTRMKLFRVQHVEHKVDQVLNQLRKQPSSQQDEEIQTCLSIELSLLEAKRRMLTQKLYTLREYMKDKVSLFQIPLVNRVFENIIANGGIGDCMIGGQMVNSADILSVLSTLRTS